MAEWAENAAMVEETRRLHRKIKKLEAQVEAMQAVVEHLAKCPISHLVDEPDDYGLWGRIETRPREWRLTLGNVRQACTIIKELAKRKPNDG